MRRRRSCVRRQSSQRIGGRSAARDALAARGGGGHIAAEVAEQQDLAAEAIALGNLLYVQGKTLHCEPPGGQGQAVTLEWGINLTEFSPRLTTVDQVNEVTVRSWDPTAKQAVVGQASSGGRAPAG